MKYLVAAIIMLLAVGTVFSMPGGKVFLYGGAGQGQVIFDAKKHASLGYVCNDCHLEVFPTAKKALITMDDHDGGKAKCFSCHNNTVAFYDDCQACHRGNRY